MAGPWTRPPGSPGPGGAPPGRRRRLLAHRPRRPRRSLDTGTRWRACAVGHGRHIAARLGGGAGGTGPPRRPRHRSKPVGTDGPRLGPSGRPTRGGPFGGRLRRGGVGGFTGVGGGVACPADGGPVGPGCGRAGSAAGGIRPGSDALARPRRKRRRGRRGSRPQRRRRTRRGPLPHRGVVHQHLPRPPPPRAGGLGRDTRRRSRRRTHRPRDQGMPPHPARPGPGLRHPALPRPRKRTRPRPAPHPALRLQLPRTGLGLGGRCLTGRRRRPCRRARRPRRRQGSGGLRRGTVGRLGSGVGSVRGGRGSGPRSAGGPRGGVQRDHPGHTRRPPPQRDMVVADDTAVRIPDTRTRPLLGRSPRRAGRTRPPSRRGRTDPLGPAAGRPRPRGTGGPAGRRHRWRARHPARITASGRTALPQLLRRRRGRRLRGTTHVRPDRTSRRRPPARRGRKPGDTPRRPAHRLPPGTVRRMDRRRGTTSPHPLAVHPHTRHGRRHPHKRRALAAVRHDAGPTRTIHPRTHQRHPLPLHRHVPPRHPRRLVRGGSHTRTLHHLSRHRPRPPAGGSVLPTAP
ncbi:hypothetical protein P376_0157 [Streptomyces sp. HCCB10043]|nr:hypothetical protein P376_0157 [Streptomyces sp. HCCB10043]